MATRRASITPEPVRMRRSSLDQPIVLPDGRVELPGYGVTLGKRQSIDNQMEVIIEDAAGVDTEADVVNLPIARVNGEEVSGHEDLVSLARRIMESGETEFEFHDQIETVETIVTYTEAADDSGDGQIVDRVVRTEVIESNSNDAAGLSLQLEEAQLKIDELQRQNDEEDEENSLIAQEKNRLYFLYTEAQETIEGLEEEIDELKARIRELEGRSADTSEISRLQTTVFERDSTIRQLTADLEVARNRPAEIRTEIVTEKDSTTSIMLAQRDQELADLNAKYRELVAQLNVAENSTSVQLHEKSQLQEELVQLKIEFNSLANENASLKVQLENAKDDQPSELLMHEIATLRAEVMQSKEGRMNFAELVRLATDGQRAVARNMKQVKSLYGELQVAVEAAKQHKHSHKRIVRKTRPVQKAITHSLPKESVYFAVDIVDSEFADRYGLIGNSCLKASRDSIAFLEPSGWETMFEIPMADLNRFGSQGSQVFIEFETDSGVQTLHLDASQASELMECLKRFVAERS